MAGFFKRALSPAVLMEENELFLCVKNFQENAAASFWGTKQKVTPLKMCPFTVWTGFLACCALHACQACNIGFFL